MQHTSSLNQSVEMSRNMKQHIEIYGKIVNSIDALKDIVVLDLSSSYTFRNNNWNNNKIEVCEYTNYGTLFRANELKVKIWYDDVNYTREECILFRVYDNNLVSITYGNKEHEAVPFQDVEFAISFLKIRFNMDITKIISIEQFSKMMNKDSINFEIETNKHIKKVQEKGAILIQELRDSLADHDSSKFSKEERELFKEYTPKLKTCTFGSPEYKEFLEGLKPALEHHYFLNSHHPESNTNGIDGMTLVDIVEMFCDWLASAERHENFDFRKSLQVCKERFNVSDQLNKIFENTYERYFEYPEDEE